MLGPIDGRRAALRRSGGCASPRLNPPKFYDGKIENGDGVERALWGMQALIGADEDTVYQKGAGIRIDNGYTYYTLRQWHGDTEVKNAIVKIIIDPDGESAAISSSVKPGVDVGTELLISPEEAVWKDFTA